MTLRTFTADQLCLSPLNVRLNAEDANATDALEASIAAHGLLFPLIVHPLPAAPARKSAKSRAADAAVMFGVLAGGRRFRAITRLIEAGTLPPEYPIEAVVRDVPPSEITELSLAENLLRRELRPYEVNAAIARAAEQGASIEEIAARTGQRTQWVRQQLRLGALHATIFGAYSEGKISIDIASAYGATADQALQLTAWKHFATRPAYEHRDYNIRAWLKVGDAELSRLLAFVGDATYRAAGGKFELDLFADASAHRGRVEDEGLLRELAERRLGDMREQIRMAAGRPDLRFAAEQPRPGGVPDAALEFAPDETGEGDARTIALPDSEEIVCTLTINDGGEVIERWWWNSRKAMAAADRASHPPKVQKRTETASPDLGSRESLVDGGAIGRDGYAQEKIARSVLRSDFGLTSDGMQIMRSTRREILRAMLVRDAREAGTLGRDYLVWAALRQKLRNDAPSKVGMLGFDTGWQYTVGDREADGTDAHLSTMPAHDEWRQAVEDIRVLRFMTEDDPFEAFGAFVYAGPDIKALAGAVLAGFGLVRSINADGYRCRAHDRIADLAQSNTVREYWKPNADFMALFPKAQRLEMAKPFVGQSVFASWQKLDSITLSASAAAVLDPATHADLALAKAAAIWVHPLLAFPIAEPGSLAAAYEKEAAHG